ncbi:MAG: DNA-directed RNA polymerase subunit B'' [Candidatus Woesearchaeota archaeon]
MNKRTETLVRRYFDEQGFVASDIESFNNFVEFELTRIIEENKSVEPTIIPANIDTFEIHLDKIWVTKPEITEADGSRRKLLPLEARIRKISYSAPIFMEISAHINGIQRESFKTQIGQLPIMLKSKYCHLHGLTENELIEAGEDPDDTGGYFIVNGTEKVLIKIEDLAANALNIDEQRTGISDYVAKVFSEKGSYKIPHTIEKLRDGIFYLTFTRVKRIPIVLIMKALGLSEEEIVTHVGLGAHSDVLVNLYQSTSIKTIEEAMDQIAKKIGITQTQDIRIERVSDILDKYLLPHVGLEEEARRRKATNLCKYLRSYVNVVNGQQEVDDKDHYKNKRLKLSGDLLADLFRVNLKVLIGDMLYNFQRIVKRGKFPSIKVIIRDKLLTQRIYSAMATGTWIGGRKGVSQRMDRMNQLATLSHLQRVVSPLSAAQENFEARSLHSTHLGRLCPTETPEGSNIGLRKNLALLARVTHEVDEEALTTKLVSLGMEVNK